MQILNDLCCLFDSIFGIVVRLAVLFALVVFVVGMWPHISDIWNALLGKLPRINKRKVKVD